MTGGVWVQLNQKQYVNKGMTHGAGLHLVQHENRLQYGITATSHLTQIALLTSCDAHFLPSFDETPGISCKL